MRTTLCIVFCFMLNTVYAQESKLSLSLRGGMNISTVTGMSSSFLELGSKKGISGGLSMGVKVTPNFLILVEAIYDQKGYKQQIFLTDPAGNTIGTANSFTNLNYVSIPIVANVVIGTKNSAEIGLGVCNNLLVNANTENPATSYGVFYPGSQDIKYQYKTYELSGIGRLAGVFHLNESISLIVESRFQYGITPCNKGFIFDYQNYRNSVIYFGTGLRIGFNKKAQ